MNHNQLCHHVLHNNFRQRTATDGGKTSAPTWHDLPSLLPEISQYLQWAKKIQKPHPNLKIFFPKNSERRRTSSRPRLKKSVSGLLLRRTRFSLKPVHVGLAVGNVTRWTLFSEFFGLSMSVSFRQSILTYISSVYYQRCRNSATDSVVK